VVAVAPDRFAVRLGVAAGLLPPQTGSELGGSRVRAPGRRRPRCFGSGLAFDTYASTGKWIELGNELALVVVGIAVVAMGTRAARGIAGGALGLLGLAVGALTFPVLLHGVVLSIFPAAAARTLLVLTPWSAAATAFGLVVFEDELASAQLGEPLRDGVRVR
jgi:hypothetical protein